MAFSITNVALTPRIAPGTAARPSVPGFGMVLYGSKGVGDVPITKVPTEGAAAAPIAFSPVSPAPVIAAVSIPADRKDLPVSDPVPSDPPRFGDDAMPNIGDSLPTIAHPALKPVPALAMAKNLPASDPTEPEPPRFGDDAMPNIGDALPTIDAAKPAAAPVTAFGPVQSKDRPAIDPVQSDPPRFGDDALPDVGPLPKIGTAKALKGPVAEPPATPARGLPAISLLQPEPPRFADAVTSDIADAPPSVAAPGHEVPPVAGEPTGPTLSSQRAATDDAQPAIVKLAAGRKTPGAISRQAVADGGTSLPPAVRDDKPASHVEAPTTSIAKPRIEGVAWPPHIFVLDPRSATPANVMPAVSIDEPAAPASVTAVTMPVPLLTAVLPTAAPTVKAAPVAGPEISVIVQSMDSSAPQVGAVVPSDVAPLSAAIVDLPFVVPNATLTSQPKPVQAMTLPAPTQTSKPDAAALAAVDTAASIQTGATLAAAAVVRATSTRDQDRPAKADAPVTTSARLLVDPTSSAAPAMQPVVASDPAAASAVVDTRDPAWTASLAARIVAAQDGLTGTGGRIRLTPDALGRVDVGIRSVAGKLHVTFDAETEGARKLLADARPELVALAARQGTTIASATVTSGESAGEPADQPDRSRSDQPQQQPDRRNRFFGAAMADPATTTFAALTERLA